MAEVRDLFILLALLSFLFIFGFFFFFFARVFFKSCVQRDDKDVQ